MSPPANDSTPSGGETPPKALAPLVAEARKPTFRSRLASFLGFGKKAPKQ